MRFLLVILLIIPLTYYSRSQSLEPIVISSGGYYFENTNHSFSATVGELVTNTIENQTHTFTQGFQQPNYTYVFVDEDFPTKLNAKIYPNPFVDHLFLELFGSPEGDLNVVFMDASGKMVKPTIRLTPSMGATLVELDVTGLASGFYFVRVYQPDGDLKVDFKLLRM